jgi:thiol-disulfide isomerase/thioredoxin
MSALHHARLFIALLVAGGCRTSDTIASDSPPHSDAGAAPEVPALAVGAKAHGLELIPAPPGDVSTLIRTGREQAKAHGRKLLVYIGATWCEPCQRFHQAAEAGLLDDKFPTLSLLVFDSDADEKRLHAALFGPGYLPYFGVPDEAGHGTSTVVSGSVKGDGAVDNITPRLLELIKKAP